MTTVDRAERRREDDGFFGKGSPTWKVWTSPTAFVGFLRSIVVETFDPFLAAAVHDQNGVRTDPRGRMNRTGQYFQTVAVGDSASAIAASELLKRVHARAVGIEPITGRRYAANDPDSQLWIHVTGWHSVLHAYERYGPGRLSAAEEQRYWAECVIAAELQTCDPAKVPRSRDEVRAYFAAVRPRLCVSERARALLHHFLRPPVPRTSPRWLTSRFAAAATIATIPRWMRELGGFDQPAWLDRAIGPAAKAVFRGLRPLPVRFRAVEHFMPAVRPIWESALLGTPMRNETTTPAQARARLG